jgi:hypothetical protein
VRLQCLRQYTHNIANLALRILDFEQYANYAHSSVSLCRNSLELAQVLNRAVKACGMVGEMSLGRNFGHAAASLETLHDRDDDPDLPAVLRGELSFLYGTTAPQEALTLAETACAMTSSPRQQVHNLYARAIANFRLGRLGQARQDLANMENLVALQGLATMRLPLTLLRGLLLMAEGSWRAAADSFRTGIAEAAWQGNRRDELRLGANLLIARALAGDHAQAQRLYEALMPMVVSTSLADTTESLRALKAETDRRLAANPEWREALDKTTSFPDLPAKGPHLASPILQNANYLSERWSDIYRPASAFGIQPTRLKEMLGSQPFDLRSAFADGQSLYPVC